MRNFEQLLDPRELTAHYVQAPALVEFPFTETFFTGARNVESDETELVYFNSAANPAPLNVRGAEARLMSVKGGNKVKMHLFHAFNYVDLGADALRALRNPDNETIMQKGEFAVERVAEDFANQHRILKEVVTAHTLLYNRVNFGVDGELLIPTVNGTTGAITDATGTLVSADWEIPNSHRGTLIDGSAIIDALWSVAGTDIVTHLYEIRRRAKRNRLPRPNNIWCNSINKPYILNNDAYEAYALRNPQANQAFLEGADFLPGLWGYNWRFFDDTYELDGTTYDLVPSELALIFPDVGPWLRTQNGSELVPMDLNLATTPQELLAKLSKVYGQFAYAKLVDNPVHLEMYMGDNWGVNFAEPNSLWVPTVFPTAS